MPVEPRSPGERLYFEIVDRFDALEEGDRYLFALNIVKDAIALHAERLTSGLGNAALVTVFHVLSRSFASRISELTSTLAEHIHNGGCQACNPQPEAKPANPGEN